MYNPNVQSRQGSSFRVFFPDFPSFEVTPQNINIRQEIGFQDVVELTYPRFSSFYTKGLKTGVPIKITWNNDKTSTEWFGYVYDVKKNINPSLEQPVIIRCIASSLSLKDSGSKIWTNKTAPDIAVDIAKKFKLKPFVTPHKTIFTQQSLSGQTYWEKLQELAGRIGYAAHVIGTELHFHPLDKMIDKFMTVIPKMSFLDMSMPPYSMTRDQTLDVFRVNLSDYSENQHDVKKTKYVYGIDPLSAELYVANSSADTVGKNLKTSVRAPIFEQLVSNVISERKEVAQVMVDSLAQYSRFVYHALAAGQGDPRIAPFRTVEVAGTGENTDGFWIVKKAEHFLTFDGRYQVNFECMTDGGGINKVSATRPSQAGAVPIRNLNDEIATGGPSTPTSSRISAPTSMFNETESGFKVNPRRWVGV